MPQTVASPRLAWLSLDSQEGQEYWAAMELMGRYAAANHALIHKHVAANLGAEVLLDLENHHNFAWQEKHVINGVEKEVIVHNRRKTDECRTKSAAECRVQTLNKRKRRERRVYLC